MVFFPQMPNKLLCNCTSQFRPRFLDFRWCQCTVYSYAKLLRASCHGFLDVIGAYQRLNLVAQFSQSSVFRKDLLTKPLPSGVIYIQAYFGQPSSIVVYQ
jgi:phosphoribosyl 1,2-cyclic phosphodiesterase